VAGSALSDPFEGFLLEEAEQLGLGGRPQLPDLIQEERPTLRRFDPPRSISDRAGEGAAGVTKQLADQQLIRKGRGAHRHEGFVGARRKTVERPGQHALARPILSAKQHGGLGESRSPEQGQGGLHRRRAGFQDFVGVDSRQPIFERLHPGAELSPLSEPFDHCPDLGRGERLGDVVARPAPDRFHGRVDGGVGGDHHQVEVGVVCQHPGEQIHPAPGPQSEVHEGQIHWGGGERGQCSFGTAGLTYLATSLLQAEPEHGTDVPLVVDDQDPVRAGSKRRGLWRSWFHGELSVRGP
jgi:hypothetical protein